MQRYRGLIAIWLLIAAALLGACRREQRIDVPRRTAYPRIQIPDSVYTPVDSIAPLHLELSPAATLDVTRRDPYGTWLDIRYPAYNAVIYLTATPVDDRSADAVLDNRSERIALNLGGAETEILSLQSGDFLSQIFINRRGGTMPVQFLSYGNNLVISGMAEIPDAASAPADSIRPIAEMLRRDVLHLVKTLK